MPELNVSIAPQNPVAAPAPVAPTTQIPGSPPAAPAAPTPDIWQDPGLAKFAKDGQVDHAALAKSYLELQQRMGAQSQTPPAIPAAPAAPATPTGGMTPERYAQISTAFAQSGKFTAEQRDEIKKAYPVDDAWLDWQERSWTNTAQLYSLQVQHEAGSAEQLAKMRYWAAAKLAPDEYQKFETVLGSGDIEQARPWIQGLKARYEQSVSEPAHQVAGRTAGPAIEPIKSRAELMKAYADPRYDIQNVGTGDPVFREEVQRRVAAGIAQGYQAALMG